METASWVTAIATVVYSIAVIVTLLLIKRQIAEGGRLRESGVVEEAYKYIISTHDARALILANSATIKAVKNKSDLESLKSKSPDLLRAIHDVVNCYHYIGFLMRSRLLTNKGALYEEGGQTILDMSEIIMPVIEIQRENPSYKQYFDTLVKEVIEYQHSQGKRKCFFRRRTA